MPGGTLFEEIASEPQQHQSPIRLLQRAAAR
jgi:hypothetical protein